MAQAKEKALDKRIEVESELELQEMKNQEAELNLMEFQSEVGLRKLKE